MNNSYSEKNAINKEDFLRINHIPQQRKDGAARYYAIRHKQLCFISSIFGLEVLGSFSCVQPGVEVRVQLGAELHVQPGVEVRV